MKIISITLILLISSFSAFGQVDEVILHSLKTHNLDEFVENFEEGYLSKSFGKDSLQALAYAAFFKSNDIVLWLLNNGAEVNSYSGELTPVMWAARSGNSKAIELLVDSRASVNLSDREGNTALIYASAGGCIECVKLLVNAGADIRVTNKYGYDAEFYAARTQNNQIRNFLRYRKIQAEFEGKPIKDGPHFRWDDNEKVRAFYFVAKANKDKVRVISKILKPESLPFSVNGFAGDTNSYTLFKEYKPFNAIYDKERKIFVLGDIHGNFNQTISILKNAGVIHEDLTWNWGSNHLVFMGDIFDRGDEVTELLWFIHSLQKQAHKADGYVHLLLGNHELMNLVNDDRYISDKYFYISQKTGMIYSETYSKSYELGKWLRSLNTMIKINDIVFVHAGISREMLERNLSIQQVNNGIRQFLASDMDTTNQDLLNFLSGESGPLWFRGFSKEGNDQASNENFENILEYYNAKRIIVGHTPAQNFRVYFDNRLIYIDVSTAEGNMDEKAMLIENNNYYKVFFDGTLKPLF